MKALKKILLSLVLSTSFVSCLVMADSPLTSTDFSGAYPEFDLIQQAKNDKNHLLTNEYAQFLTSQNIPLGARAALVNTLGTGTNDNAPLFLNYLENKDVSSPATSDPAKLLGQASADKLALYAYMLAMYNYSNVDNALGWALTAAYEEPNSLTINMILALIHAQVEFDRNWCRVYGVVDNVRNNLNLNRDLKEAAVTDIFEYINLYKTECR